MQNAAFFSSITDTIQDMSKVDQLSLIARYTQIKTSNEEH